MVYWALKESPLGQREQKEKEQYKKGEVWASMRNREKRRGTDRGAQGLTNPTLPFGTTTREVGGVSQVTLYSFHLLSFFLPSSLLCFSFPSYLSSFFLFLFVHSCCQWTPWPLARFVNCWCCFFVLFYFVYSIIIFLTLILFAVFTISGEALPMTSSCC